MERARRYSPLAGAAVDDDGQDRDEHGHPTTDGNQLLRLRQSVSEIADEHAAVSGVRGRAAAREEREICECIPMVNTNQHVHVDMKQAQ